MANEIELTDLRMKVSIDLTGTITADSPDIIRLVQLLAAASSAADLASVLCERASPGRYLYQLTTRDGRVWNQTINIGEDSNPGMTFNVPDEWRMSEFEPHRALRALCIGLIQKHGVSKVRAMFIGGSA